MGLFDFLHGISNQKSEAELYMEQRNKEYARRAAEYRRREVMNSSAGSDFANDIKSRISNRVSFQSTTSYKNNNVTRQQTRPKTSTVYLSVSKPYTSSCDDCEKSTSLFDDVNSNIFKIEKAFVQSGTRMVTARGNIVRGSFKIGDKVELNTSVESRPVTVQRIIRQGEQTTYANTSSGAIAIVISNASDIVVRAGDTLKKK